MMLDEVLQSAIEGHHLTTARVGPMRTAVKQFSAMFGLDPAQLAPEQYHLPKDALFRFIEQHSAPDLGPSTLRNRKNNLHWLLKLAVREGWLRPPPTDALPWPARYRDRHQSLARPRLDHSRANPSRYTLLQPIAAPPTSIEDDDVTPRQPETGLHGYQRRQRQGLQVAPHAFLDEIATYLEWCQRTYAPDRDAKVRKRAISAQNTRVNLLRIGGYAHHIAGIPLEDLTLERLTDPAFVQAFVSWWINTRRGRVTVTIDHDLSTLEVIARHWLRQTARAESLKAIRASLANDQGPVWDKEQAVLPLRTLEDVGLRTYPFTAERLQRSWPLRTIYRDVQDTAQGARVPRGVGTRAWRITAHQVMMSLIIRLLVRLPMRQRCIREMRLGHNLKQRADGHWEIHFRGLELKIASRKTTGLNEYRHPVPPELTGLIHEWLTWGRPRLLPVEGSDLVFINLSGHPYRAGLLNTSFYRTVYRFTGIRTSIHLIRDSWASDYLDATGDVSGCADMLGDTVQMVLTHYAHVLKRRAQGRTASWLQTHLGSAGQ